MDRALRYTDRASNTDREQANRDLETILVNAWTDRDPDKARACLDLLADRLDIEGSTAAATHLRNAADETFTFITHPDAGWLVAGHKGRPDVGTGVLERVMREMNRRTDIGSPYSHHSPPEPDVISRPRYRLIRTRIRLHRHRR